MKNLNRIIFPCLVFMVAAVASCGYRLEGGGYLNDNVVSVAVQVLENKSSESGAEMQFTNALIREILQKTDTKVVDKSYGTDFFQGTITSITFSSLSRSTSNMVIERRVSATVDLKLVNTDGNVVWSVKNFTWHEDYTVAAMNVGDTFNKKVAVEKIAVRMAEKLVSQLLTNF